MPQGLGFGASRLTAPATLSASLLPPWLTVHFFCGSPASLPPCLAVIICASLQLSSRCWPPSRTLSRSASLGSWAPLAQVGPQPLPPLACLRPPQLLQRPWCQLPPEPVLALALLHRCPHGHRGAAPAPAQARVALSPLLTREWSRRSAPPLSRRPSAATWRGSRGVCTLCTSLCGFPRFRLCVRL